MDKVTWLGGISALAAVPTLILAGVTLALFFNGKGDWLGSANDLLSALALLLLIMPVWVFYRLYQGQTGGWLLYSTVAAFVGIGLASAGQVFLVIRIIGLNASFVTGGIGIIPIILWAIAFLLLTLQHGPLPSSLGWLLVAVLILSAISTLASSVHWQGATWAFSALLVAMLCTWLGSLGVALLHSA